MNNLGDRIKELLEKNKMSQKELAEKTLCTEAAISHYIKGDRTPRASVLAKLAIALNTTSDYLMEGIPVDSHSEIDYATKLIARNSSALSKEEKRRILDILMGGIDE